MDKLKFILYLGLTLVGLPGCIILSNLDELNTLGAYSREKDAQHRLVQEIDAHYDALSSVIDHGAIGNYKDQDAFIHAFGDPILKKDLNGNGQRWLYRHAIYKLSKDKVYLYFDNKSRLIKWERLPCPKLF